MHFAPLRYAIVVQWLAFGEMEENKEIPLAPEIDDRKEGKTTFFLISLCSFEDYGELRLTR